MDRNELSSLAFLIRALAVNPRMTTFDAARSNMEFGGSSSFRASIIILQRLVERVSEKNTSTEQLFSCLSDETKKLTRSKRPLEKSIGQALMWALESIKYPIYD